jgi:8-oxo-dGTP diphosphatase
MTQQEREQILAEVGTDVVFFTMRQERLCVLLVRREREPYGGRWSLPGGMVGRHETLDAAARRMLASKTGVEGVYLEQLFTFGGISRDPRGRVVSVAYYALVASDRMPSVRNMPNIAWHEADALPELAFDHADMIAMARRRLASKLEYSTIALQLMPEKFTLSELQAVYEHILGETLDKRNFRKRLQGLGCLEATGEHHRAGKHRPAKLYRMKSPGRVEFIK